MTDKDKRRAKRKAPRSRDAAPLPDAGGSPQENSGQALRRRADATLREQVARSPENLAALSPEETQRMLHELRVHQIELELQNEDLRRAQVELDAARARYFDLYDLAPVSYCSVSETGLIVEANLAAATLLGAGRGGLVRQPFSRFIFKDDQDSYYWLRKQLAESGQPQSCELRMVNVDARQFWAQLTATTAQDEGGAPEIRIVLSDITERRRAAEELRDLHRLSARLFEVHDQARKHVAKELHENVSQYLAILGMYLSSAPYLGVTPSVEVKRFLGEGRTLLRGYSSEIQTMADTLYPEALDELGLATAIKEHVGGFAERHGIEVRLDIAPDLGRLPAEHELALFRVMEQALTNVCTHSGSKTATVRVFRDALEVGLEVIDAGRGLPLQKGPAIGCSAEDMGIQEIRERIRNLGGRLEIDSGSEGTTVRAVLWLDPQAREVQNDQRA